MRSLARAVTTATILSALVAGCGGSGGGLVSAVPRGPQAGVAAPESSISSSLTIVVPRKQSVKRRVVPKYVSPSTQSVRIKIGKTNSVIALTTPAPCTVSASAETCTVSIKLPVGNNERISVLTYSTTNATGTPLTKNAIVVNVSPGQNQLTLSLGGVVTSWTLTLSTNTISAFSRSIFRATYTAYTANGAAIIGISPAAPLVDPKGKPITVGLSVVSGPGTVGTAVGNTWPVTEAYPQSGMVYVQLYSSSNRPAAVTQAIPIVTADDWNTFGHDMKRTGYDTLPNPITKATSPQLQLKWSRSFPGYKFYASPIVVNGTVYVVPTNNILYAIDAQTGNIKWQTPIVPQYPTYQGFLTPSLYDGKIFVGSYTSNGILAAIDPIAGHVLWRTAFQPGSFRSSPVSVNGTLYIGEAFGDPPACQPGGVYAYDENTGANIESWLTSPYTPRQDGGGVWGPLTWTGSTIAFGTGNTCVDNPATGDAIVGVSPAGSALTGMWHIQTVPDATKNDDDVAGGVLDVNNVGYVSAKNGNLYAMDLATGDLLWSKNLGAPDKLGGFATPGYVGGTLFASRGYSTTTPSGGTLFGLDLSGNTKWSISSNNILLGEVVGVNDVAFAEIDNSINAIDPATGAILWSWGTQGQFEASPAIVPSGLFVNDLSGTLYAFSLPTQGFSKEHLVGSDLKQTARGATKYPVPRPPDYCLLP